MFKIDADLTIACTRGDAALFFVRATVNDAPYTFRVDDVVRFSVFEKRDYSRVVLRKEVQVYQETEKVTIELSGKETRIGDVISKPVDYCYEVELNPQTCPQTIIGYDETGAKIFRLYPESEVQE